MNDSDLVDSQTASVRVLLAFTSVEGAKVVIYYLVRYF